MEIYSISEVIKDMQMQKIYIFAQKFVNNYVRKHMIKQTYLFVRIQNIKAFLEESASTHQIYRDKSKTIT